MPADTENHATSLRFCTWNVFEFGSRRAPQRQGENVVAVLNEIQPDVLAVQEIYGRGQSTAESAMRFLARRTGMECSVPSGDDDANGTVAVAHASGDPDSLFHVGLLWNPARVRPGRIRTCDGEMWHNIISMIARVGPRAIRIASYHGPPFGKHARADEAERVASEMTRPYDSAPPGIIGGDWNAIGADLVADPDTGTYVPYHPDPYPALPWSPALIHHADWDTDPDTGRPTNWRADRRPGVILRDGGLADAAAIQNGPWQRTCGHAAHADAGERAIDLVRTTADVTPAVVGHQVLDTPAARAASDHLPVVVDLDLDRIVDPPDDADELTYERAVNSLGLYGGRSA